MCQYSNRSQINSNLNLRITQLTCYMNYHSKIIDMMLNSDEAVYKTSAIERDYLKPNIRQLHAVMCFAFCFGQICKGSSSKPPAPRPPIENPPKPPLKKRSGKRRLEMSMSWFIIS